MNRSDSSIMLPSFNRNISYHIIYNELKDQDLELLSQVYFSNFSSLTVRCHNRHIFNQSLFVIRKHNYLCPLCKDFLKYPFLVQLTQKSSETINIEINRLSKIMYLFVLRVLKEHIVLPDHCWIYLQDCVHRLLQAIYKKFDHNFLPLQIRFIVLHVFAIILDLYSIMKRDAFYFLFHLPLNTTIQYFLKYNESLIEKNLQIYSIFDYRKFWNTSNITTCTVVDHINQMNILASPFEFAELEPTLIQLTETEKESLAAPLPFLITPEPKTLHIPEEKPLLPLEPPLSPIETKVLPKSEEKPSKPLEPTLSPIEPKPIEISKPSPLLTVIPVTPKPLVKPKYDLYAFDVNNLINSMKSKFGNTMRGLHPFTKLKPLITADSEVYCFASRHLDYAKKALPISSKVHWSFEDYKKMNGEYIDVDGTLCGTVAPIIVSDEKQINHFYLGSGDKDLHILLDLAKKLKIKTTVIVIEDMNLSHELKRLADAIILLY